MPLIAAPLPSPSIFKSKAVLLMLRLSFRLIRRSTSRALSLGQDCSTPAGDFFFIQRICGLPLPPHALSYRTSPASSPSLSIWRRKKEIGKEGLIAAKELKRLQSNPVRIDRFIKSHVSRLLKSDLVSIVAEFQRQDQVFLCMKLYDVVRQEIWYRPDMFFYRDMLMMLARNRSVDEAKRVWKDLKGEGVLFDQHTFGDIMRAFLDSGLPSEAMEIYEEMRRSPEPPLSLPFRVILKGLIPYPELREMVKDDFLELFPGMIVYDPPEDLFDDEECKKENE